MTCAELVEAIERLKPEAGYSVQADVLKKRGRPRELTVDVCIWFEHRTLKYECATPDEAWARIESDVVKRPSRLGDFNLERIGGVA